MLAKATLSITLIVAVSGFSIHAPSKNTVQDALDQAGRYVRCWEPKDRKEPATAYVLSEPVFEMCSYMSSPENFEDFYVNGVDMDSDDYTNIQAIFGATAPGHAVLNVCLQEAFQFHAAGHPSQLSFRCLCKRDGCNMPKGLTTFLEFNKLAIPQAN
ncbi:unnamed protein product [Caenorhabditis sp. 36 PRJEB53466]|nr:unnamed protein product [Caenorhabditis sp. 36 PRJEB53466]